MPFLLLAIVGFSAVHIGHLFRQLGLPNRLILGIAAAVIMLPGLTTTLAGSAAILAVAAFDFWRMRHAQTA